MSAFRLLPSCLTPRFVGVFLLGGGLLVGGCDLEHEGSGDLIPEQTGGLATGGFGNVGLEPAAAGQATGGFGAAGNIGGTGGTGAVVSTGGTGTGGMSTGGMSTGGMSTGGASTGGSATGGATTGGAPNDPDCPTTEPNDGMMCTPSFGPTLECRYASVTCTCAGFGMGAQWDCYSANCPPTMPWGDLSCTGLDGTSCPYGGMDCLCVSGTWYCG